MVLDAGRAAVACVSALSFACAGSTGDLVIDSGTRCFSCASEACATEPLEITVLGAAGYAFTRDSDTILVDPFFSNPSFLRVALHLAIESDPAAVSVGMKDVPSASAVLVGHAHYDHLLDVPTVVREMTPRPGIYASETARNVLAAFDLLEDTTPLDAIAWSPGQPVEWTQIEGTRIRFLTVRSEHAPHFAGYTAMKGEYTNPLTEPPRSAFDWIGGATFAFVIDFLARDGSTDFRVLLHDSAADEGFGLPPSDLADARVRVAIPCVASFHQVDSYPESLVAGFDPSFIVLGHWEDFFRPYSQSPEDVRAVPGTDVATFVKRLDAASRDDSTPAPRTLPLPGTRIRFAKDCPSPASVERAPSR